MRNNIPQPETVASHSFGAAFLAFLFAKKCGVNEQKAIKMALLHDVQESVVGDYTPMDKITDKEKYEKELSAVQNIADKLKNEEMKALFIEFEEA